MKPRWGRQSREAVGPLGRCFAVATVLIAVVSLGVAVLCGIQQWVAQVWLAVCIIAALLARSGHGAWRRRAHVATRAGLSVLALGGVMLWVVSTIGFVCLFNWTAEVTSVGQYEQSLSHWFEPSTVADFPSATPPDAEDVQFSFKPRFLEWQSHIQLKVRLPRERIEEL